MHVPARRGLIATLLALAALTAGYTNAAREQSGDSVRWTQIATERGVMRAALARPDGAGPFPALIILHGTHGFAEEYVQLAREMARHGILGVAACWFRGRQGAGVKVITPVDCPDAPPLIDEAGPERFRIARQSIDALVRHVRSLPELQADHVVLFGHSRGAGATLDYILTHPNGVKAAVLNSAGYPAELRTPASDIRVPLLIFHGTADGPADGGSPATSIDMARGFEAALRRAGQRVESKYYQGGGHNSIFTTASQRQDTVQRVTAFVRSLFTVR